MQQTKMTLQELIDTAEARLVELNYSPNTTYIFHRCWLDLLAYAEERNEKNFSVELGEKYLLERRGIDVLADESTLGLTRSKIRPYKRAIYLLADLQRSGVVLRKRRTKRTEVPARFTPILEHYLVMVRSRNNSEGTISKGVSHKMCEAPFAIKLLCEPPVLTGGFSFCPKTKISRLGVFRFLDKSVR